MTALWNFLREYRRFPLLLLIGMLVVAVLVEVLVQGAALWIQKLPIVGFLGFGFLRIRPR